MMTTHEDLLLDILDTAREFLGGIKSASLVHLAPHFSVPGTEYFH